MVTVKIQSKEDIIRAYLKSFGFNDKKLEVITQTVLTRLNNSALKNAEDLVLFIDDILLKQAQQIFTSSTLPPTQLLAQFKLCFLLCDGANACSEDNLKQLRLPLQLIKDMQKHYVVNAPQYHYADMKPQVIESL